MPSLLFTAAVNLACAKGQAAGEKMNGEREKANKKTKYSNPVPFTPWVWGLCAPVNRARAGPIVSHNILLTVGTATGFCGVMCPCVVVSCGGESQTLIRPNSHCC